MASEELPCVVFLAHTKLASDTGERKSLYIYIYVL